MKVTALKQVSLPESYVEIPTEVGYFSIPSELKPYEWAKVPLTLTTEAKPLEYQWALVTHNGRGKVYGESCHESEPIPTTKLKEFYFELPTSHENYTYV